MFSLVVILKNEKVLRVLKGFHTTDGDIALHALRAVVKDHPELKGSLKQQERRALGLSFSTGTVYAVKYGKKAGETFCVDHPECHESVGWTRGTTYSKV